VRYLSPGANLPKYLRMIPIPTRRLLLALAMMIAIAFTILAASPARADSAAGMAALKVGYFSRAHALLLLEAEIGDPAAQYEIGRMLDSGRGAGVDTAAAVTWFRAAAEQGHARAQHALGTYYEEGKELAQDYV